MKSLEMTVRGVKRLVHIEKEVNPNLWRARINVGKSTVSGFVKVNKAGAKRFSPIGVNAYLI